MVPCLSFQKRFRYFLAINTLFSSSLSIAVYVSKEPFAILNEVSNNCSSSLYCIPTFSNCRLAISFFERKGIHLKHHIVL